MGHAALTMSIPFETYTNDVLRKVASPSFTIIFYQNGFFFVKQLI